METIRNAYPALPVVDYEHTTVSKQAVIDFLKKLPAHAEAKLGTLAIFCNESGNGKSGVNNNYTGLQADGARLGGEWDNHVIATCLVKENRTGNMRRFCVFADFTTCVAHLLEKVQKRGLYIGGYATPYAKLKIYSEKDWARAYWKEWVMGDAQAEPPTAQLLELINLYQGTKNIF